MTTPIGGSLSGQFAPTLQTQAREPAYLAACNDPHVRCPLETAVRWLTCGSTVCTGMLRETALFVQLGPAVELCVHEGSVGHAGLDVGPPADEVYDPVP